MFAAGGALVLTQEKKKPTSTNSMYLYSTLHPKLTAPLVESVFGIMSEVCGGAFLRSLFCRNNQRVLLTIFAEELRC